VRWAVGGAAVLCLAALGRTLVAPTTHASAPAASAVNALSAVSTEPARVEAAPEPKAAAAAVAAPPPAETAELAAAPAADPAEPARVEAPRVDIPKAAEKAEAPAPAAPPSDDDKANALKAADAIAAGERSVALDPTDGEAWLILGAAYQDRGNMADARRAYMACTKEGTRGPIGECRAMLR
jgi:cytochrome c-type biogenesis protein CcmH/NrfG